MSIHKYMIGLKTTTHRAAAMFTELKALRCFTFPVNLKSKDCRGTNEMHNANFVSAGYIFQLDTNKMTTALQATCRAPYARTVVAGNLIFVCTQRSPAFLQQHCGSLHATSKCLIGSDLHNTGQCVMKEQGTPWHSA